MGPARVQGGSRVGPGWIQGGSKEGPGRVQGGSREDPGWFQGGSRDLRFDQEVNAGEEQKRGCSGGFRAGFGVRALGVARPKLGLG